MISGNVSVTFGRLSSSDKLLAIIAMDVWTAVTDDLLGAEFAPVAVAKTHLISSRIAEMRPLEVTGVYK